MVFPYQFLCSFCFWRARQDLSSLTGYRTCAPCNGSSRQVPHFNFWLLLVYKKIWFFSYIALVICSLAKHTYYSTSPVLHSMRFLTEMILSSASRVSPLPFQSECLFFFLFPFSPSLALFPSLSFPFFLMETLAERWDPLAHTVKTDILVWFLSAEEEYSVFPD